MCLRNEWDYTSVGIWNVGSSLADARIPDAWRERKPRRVELLLDKAATRHWGKLTRDLFCSYAKPCSTESTQHTENEVRRLQQKLEKNTFIMHKIYYYWLQSFSAAWNRSLENVILNIIKAYTQWEHTVSVWPDYRDHCSLNTESCHV